MGEGTWIAAHEGYYGPPLRHEQRLELVRWLGAHGFDGYAVLTEGRRTEPGPVARALPARGDGGVRRAARPACEAAGIELVVMVSPGLDWRAGDPSEAEAVAAKLTSFVEIGVSSFATNWDDVPGAGVVAGAEHGCGGGSGCRRDGRGRSAADLDELPRRLRGERRDRLPVGVRRRGADRGGAGVDGS